MITSSQSPVLRPQDTLVARLAGVQPGSALAAALATREEFVLNTEASGHVLFEGGDLQRLGLAQRLAFALATSQAQADAQLSAHYRQRLAAAGGAPADDARQQAALAHVQRLATAPVNAGPADLRALEAAGWSADAIVTLAQIVAYTSFQSRLVAGLRLIAGTADQATAVPLEVHAGTWHAQPQTDSGKPAPTAFTRDELGWEPWLLPRDRATLTDGEAAKLEKAGHLHSDYFMLLARDLPVLEHRTRTDKGIFYSHGGLPRAERELAATVTSKVNGCIYCASVHARKAAQLSGELSAVDALLAVAPGADLAAGQAPRWQPQIRLAAQLAATPQAANASHVAALRAIGLSELALLDLVGAVAFFSWANRLMLTLGEPFLPAA